MKKLIIFILLIIYLTGIGYLSAKQYLDQIVLPQNFLILGLDPRNDLLEKTETTDTIIYAHLSNNSSEVKLFSLPRDLWFYPTSQKINQIYPDSLKTANSFNYIQTNFSLLVGQKIDKTIIITTENLRQIADLVGGIDVYLDKELKDEKYPNQAYIDNPKSSAPIYKTIFYPAGKNHLDSSNITEFVRSRKSSETAATGGTDLGRIVRQQQLINALLSKLMSIREPKKILQIYQYFDTQVSHNFSHQDYLNFGLKLAPNLTKFKLTKITIPTGENPKTDIIFHPQKFINAQWVFITSTSDYQSLKSFISKSLLY